MFNEAKYLWACELAEQEQYLSAYIKLYSIRDYSDVNEFLAVLTDVIYCEGQELYHEGQYTQAKSYFECIDPYLDSDSYLTLIEAHQPDIRLFLLHSSITEFVNKLIDLINFEDASQLLLSEDYADHYLRGTWKGDGYYFTMKADGHISYNLPRIEFGDYYRIEDGVILHYPEGKRDQTRASFSLSAISRDCIVVYCHKNGQSYTLYRQ